MQKNSGRKQARSYQSFSKNKKAFADFEILEKFEAGIVLTGSEVKSVKTGHAQLKGGFIDIKNNAAWLRNIHIARYKYDANSLFNPLRKRKLLLHKKQILTLDAALNTKGSTIIPLEFYEKNGLVKLSIGVCRGKKKYDRREELKKRAQDLEVAKAMKKFSR